MQRFAENGDESRLHFTDAEGTIPGAHELNAMGVKLFVGVGHETTGATTYTEEDVTNLLAWIDIDPANHHAIIDATSMLGAMPWSQASVTAFTERMSAPVFSEMKWARRAESSIPACPITRLLGNPETSAASVVI